MVNPSDVLEVKNASPSLCVTSRFMVHQKQPENVEYFKYFGSMTTNNAKCTREIKSRVAMAKATFNEKKTLFRSKLDLNLRKELVKC
jgi:phage-related protein